MTSRDGHESRRILVLVLIGVLVTLIFYCNLYDETPIEVKTSSVGLVQENRSNAGLLLELRDRSVADDLFKKVRVLCWVMTQPKNGRHVKHIKATWGKRCNGLLFMTTAESNGTRMPKIPLPVKEGDDYQWEKTKAAFSYVYQHHRDHANWFLKVDDDTYVVLENLRYMLASHNSNRPLHFGSQLKRKDNYARGGAGYVLSRAALEVLVVEGLTGARRCRHYQRGAGDLDMEKCLSRLGVSAGDSGNSLRRGRFLPSNEDDHQFEKSDMFWDWNYVYYPTQRDPNSYSEYAISFHYINPNTMYVLDYLIYQLHPYGIQYPVDKYLKIVDNALENKTFNNNVVSFTDDTLL